MTIFQPRWRHFISALFWLLLLSFSGTGYAQNRGQGIEIWSQGSTHIVAVPGQIFSMAVVVENQTPKVRTFRETLELPPGWQSLLPSSRVDLKTYEPATRLISFVVPSDTPAGFYTVNFNISGQNRPDILDWVEFTVEIKPVVSLHLEVESVPTFLIAGQAGTATLILINDGNAPANVSLSSPHAKDLTVEISPSDVVISPGGEAVITVTLASRGDRRRSAQEIVKILATPIPKKGAEKSPKSMASTGAVLTLELLPEADIRPKRFVSIPTKLSATTHLEDGILTPQLSWEGAGALDPKRKRTLDFMLRGPDASQNAPVLGLRDEYWLRYKGEQVAVIAGDQTYRMSWLTEAATYGRGAEVKVKVGRAEFGAFYVMPRFQRPDPNKAAAFVAVETGKWGSIRFNGLLKQPSAASTTDNPSGVLSTEIHLHAGDNHHLKAELAGSSALTGSTQSLAGAYRIEANGDAGARLSYNLQRLVAAPTFSGYFHDTNLSRITGLYTLGEAYRLKAYYQGRSQNLDLNPDLKTARQTRVIELAAQCLTQTSFCYDGGLKGTYYYDPLLFPGKQGFDHRAQFRLLKGGEPWRIDARAAGGMAQALSATTPSPLFTSQFIGTYAPDKAHSLALTARLKYNGADHQSLQDTRRSLGLRSRWAFGDAASIGGEYQISHSTTLFHQVEVNADIPLPGLFALSGTLRYQSSRAETPASVAALVNLTRTFNMPVIPQKNAGSVRGRVLDGASDGQKGIAKVIVKMGGATAITDSKGRFTLHDLAPGTYPIYVDDQSLGPNRLLIGGQGQDIEVRGASVSRITLRAVQGAEVQGNLSLKSDAAPLTLQGDDLFLKGSGQAKAVNLGAIPIELRQGDVVLSRLTRRDGSFLFQGLTPGIWTLHIKESGLPAQHGIDRSSVDIHLESGVSEKISLTLSPKLRHVQMLGDGQTQHLSSP